MRGKRRAREARRQREWVRSVLVRQREAPKRTLAFFKALDLDSIEPVLEEAHEVAEGLVRDDVYRIFHRSWKMYDLSNTTIELARLMLVPLGVKRTATPKVVLASMRRWHLDDLFVDIFSRTASAEWSEARNNAPDAWREDATQLAAGFMVVREVAFASLEAMARMRRREGFMFDEDALDPTDALFLEVWTDVGTGLRYTRPKGLVERVRALLAKPRQVGRGRTTEPIVGRRQPRFLITK